MGIVKGYSEPVPICYNLSFCWFFFLFQVLENPQF